jgi:NADH:ubiquinone oxidoreductase subunit K
MADAPTLIAQLLPFWVVIGLLLVCGLYLTLVTRNLLRLLMGIEMLSKGATLLLVVVGKATGRVDLAQSFVVTLVVVEVVVVAVAAGVVFAVWRRFGSLDTSVLKTMKG